MNFNCSRHYNGKIKLLIFHQKIVVIRSELASRCRKWTVLSVVHPFARHKSTVEITLRDSTPFKKRPKKLGHCKHLYTQKTHCSSTTTRASFHFSSSSYSEFELQSWGRVLDFTLKSERRLEVLLSLFIFSVDFS